MSGTAMTVAERLEISKLMKRREKSAKAAAVAIGAQRLAQAEAQLAARYPENHPAWATLAARIKQQAADADAELATICAQMGIPPEFRPTLHAHWYSRGENAMKERRAELRAVAKTKIEAQVRTAVAKIEHDTMEQLTKLYTGLITSDEGRTFLSSMPTIDQLVPPIMLSELEGTIAPRLAP